MKFDQLLPSTWAIEGLLYVLLPSHWDDPSNRSHSSDKALFKSTQKVYFTSHFWTTVLWCPYLPIRASGSMIAYQTVPGSLGLNAWCVIVKEALLVHILISHFSRVPVSISAAPPASSSYVDKCLDPGLIAWLQANMILVFYQLILWSCLFSMLQLINLPGLSHCSGEIPYSFSQCVSIWNHIWMNKWCLKFTFNSF